MLIWRQFFIITLLLSFKYCNIESHSHHLSDFGKSVLVYDSTSSHARSISIAIDRLFSKLSNEGNFNGTVLYGEKGKILFENAYGSANLLNHDPLEINSAFQLASVSKMFTATAIMLLREQGRLDYDEAVNHYIPGFPYTGVTIRQLLTHRSGLPEYLYLTDQLWDPSIPFSNKDLINILNSGKPAPYYKPDKVFDYCNTNYALLALVVENISEMAFEEFIKTRIFNVLGMNDSYVYRSGKDVSTDEPVPAKVQGHIFSGRRLVPVKNEFLNGVVGDKGVYSTVRDLYIFDRALYSEILLKKETIAEAFEPGSPYKGGMNNYGFGWRMKRNIEGVVYHFGWWKGFRAYFIRDIAQERVMIVLTNTQKGVSSEHLWKLMGIDKYSTDNLLAGKR